MVELGQLLGHCAHLQEMNLLDFRASHRRLCEVHGDRHALLRADPSLRRHAVVQAILVIELAPT